ncbi:hypothetical protein PanWU01x14_136840, partial [Parasponia andersonii]
GSRPISRHHPAAGISTELTSTAAKPTPASYSRLGAYSRRRRRSGHFGFLAVGDNSDLRSISNRAC